MGEKCGQRSKLRGCRAFSFGNIFFSSQYVTSLGLFFSQIGSCGFLFILTCSHVSVFLRRASDGVAPSHYPTTRFWRWVQRKKWKKKNAKNSILLKSSFVGFLFIFFTKQIDVHYPTTSLFWSISGLPHYGP